ncbi:heat shock 70 kDa protein 12A-like [Ruditapes philippinarum]|uniref:heat shock 70 kDa protein 12A-like n=1 Tax=Ruditapes philippinarum TaxID=129788 RepID=UPI00295B347A|nr:heat shock 70 kDa protein 12A-like [Ruditapes philippinarum]
MTSYIAVLRLDESSTGWALSYGDARNRDYNEVRAPMPLKLLYEPGGDTEIYLGHTAVSKHKDYIDSAHTGYYFFTNIFSLLTKTSRKDDNMVLIEDDSGKSLPAVNVFAMIIQSLIDDMKRRLSSRFTFDDKKDIFYVIVVPALLQESRELDLITKAALKAGIEDKMVSVVTDIVALSFFCQFASSHGFSTEDKYLFVRLGGTMDIMKQGCKQKDGSKSRSTVSSFQDGMIQVEEGIENFMIEIFRKDVFEKFKALNFTEYMELKHDIAIKLRSVSIHTEKVHLRIPTSLLVMYKDITKKAFKDDLCKFRDIAMVGDKIKMPASQFMDPLEKAKIGVLSHIKAELENENMNSILVFGEFAQTKVIQEEVKLLHGNVKFISDEDILSGAVAAGKMKTPGQIIKLAPETIMVASLDLGTTYSGWAYSFLSDFISDPRKISVRNWNAGSILTPKTPTCLLVKPDGKTIEAFGYEAENKYRELIEDNMHASYYFFRRFKMTLNRKLSEKINRNLMLEDETGRSLLAIDVFAMSIRFLKDDLLETCNKRISGPIVAREVQWVLTVPAIWNDGAKQFMREAALRAGIEGRRLTLALEPESASIYCRHQNISATNNAARDKDISCFEVGTRYMVIDAGGGTVDITIHEVCENGKIKEVHAACGGDWGGTSVDKEFETVLLELVGRQIFQRFKKENMEEYLDLCRDFEVRKALIAPTSNRTTGFTIPLSLMNEFKGTTHEDLAKSVSKTPYAKDIKIKNFNKMTISANMMKSFFKNSINCIIPFVRNILVSKNVSAILMVGGYSESIMLQEAVKTNFPEIEIVVPEETSYTVMRGAVIFGYIPTIMSTRILKYTYGVRVAEKFLKGKHPESKLVQTDDGDKCNDIFDKHVEKDKVVNVGETKVWRVYTPMQKTQKQINISVFASEKTNPEYTDQDCHFVGKMIVDLTDDGELDRKIEVALSFSCTEIAVSAKELKTGKETHSTIDFLG